MHALKRPLALVVAAVVMVVGFDLATYAATGDSLIIGKSNTSKKVTKLKRTTGGPVLLLKAKKNSPPLAVSSSGRVDNLNADLVDGFTSKELLTNTTTVHLGLAAQQSDPSWNVSLPDGSYVVNWQAFVDLTSDVEVLCGFVVGSDFVAMGSSAVTQFFVDTLSGSGVVTFGSATNEQFFCNANGADIQPFVGNQGIELVFQKVESNAELTVAANP